MLAGPERFRSRKRQVDLSEHLPIGAPPLRGDDARVLIRQPKVR
jgi:hypothetical protein